MAGPVKNDTAFRAETPEGIEYTLYPAGICARFCAYALDSVFRWLFLAAFMLIYYLALHAAAGMWLILLVHFCLDWFYHVICDLLFRGQSPGKRLLGLRVVESDGSPVSPASSFIRNLLRFFDSFMGLYLIAFLSAAASRGFRRPGDWAAGTLVIYTWQSQIPQRTGVMDWLSGINPASPGRALSFEEKQGILMFARRYPLLGPARADEIAAPLAVSLGHTAETGPADYLLGITRSFAGTP
ncbi:RDD family protein [Spirochaetia bacterium]|nr:RDD family protein [Spirochaetia bacterium]